MANDATDNTDAKATKAPSRALQTAANGASNVTTTVDFLDKPDYRDYERASGTGHRHPMRGFYDEYTDIVDYIVRATHKMWEEGGAGLLYDHYAHNTKVWSDWGYTFGRDQTLGYIAQRFAGFPDWRIYADEVIWAGDDTEGFRTYHRAVQNGYNAGWTKYGPPTGKRVQFRGVAFCIVKDNYISEEWLVHDELTIVRQLGLDVDDTLRHLAQAADKGVLNDLVIDPPHKEGQGTPLQYVPQRPGAFDVEDFVRGAMHDVWNWRLLNKIPDYYARTVPLHAPTSRELYGLGGVRAFVTNLHAAFPDFTAEIDDVYYNGDERDGYRVAVRWNFTGTHRGYSTYGLPTGKQARSIVATEFRIKGGQIVEEWTMFNELALLWQLKYR